MTESQWVIREGDAEPKAYMCSGVLPIPSHYCGMILQCTKTLTLTGVVGKGEYVYAEPGDLCMVVNVGDTDGWTGFTPNYQVGIRFLNGGSMSLSRQGIEEHFRVLKDFPRKLSEMRKYRYKNE